MGENMKRLLLIAALLFPTSAMAQSQVMQAKAVATCGAQSLTAGIFYPATQNLTGTLCTGSGGSSAVTIADGADVTQGALADAASTAGGTGSLSAKLRLVTTQLNTINTTLGTPAQAPTTTGGLSVYFVQPTSSDNHANIKNGAGQVYKISVTNNSATVNYIRLYNAGSGFNGCNSATNLVYASAIPASTTVGGILDSWEAGIAFSTGISICVTSGYATNDTTNATATAMNVNIGYK